MLDISRSQDSHRAVVKLRSDRNADLKEGAATLPYLFWRYVKLNDLEMAGGVP